MKKTIVVGGAGPAGITFAYEILKNNSDIFDVIILEKSNTVGGISQTYNYKGNRIDIGGHRFFSKSDKVMNWWFNIMSEQSSLPYDYKELGINAPINIHGKDPEKEDDVFLIRSRLSRIFYLKKFFDYPVSLSMKTISNLGIFNTILCGISYLKSKIIKMNDSNFEGFLVNRFGYRLYDLFFKDYTHKVWGKWPNELDAAWGAQRIKGLSLMKVFTHAFSKLISGNNNSNNNKVETSLIGQFWYPKFGPGQLWEKSLEKVKEFGGKIEMESKVVSTKLENGRIKKVIYEKKGELIELECDYFVSTLPIKELFINMVGVDDDIKKIASGLEYRDFFTVGVLVNKMKIKNETSIPTLNNIPPDNWIYIQEREVKVGRIQIFNNWSPYMVRDRNKVWIGMEYFCQEGDELRSMEDEKLKEFAIGELDQIGIIDKEEVIDSIILRVEKAYPAYFGEGYKKFNIIKDKINSIENLFCIGRNGMHRYNNQDHSMLSAMEAANLIINGRTDKTSIWNINTEEEYHEEKK